MFGLRRGNQPQHFAGTIRIRHHVAQFMGAQQTPFRRTLADRIAFKGSVLNHRNRNAIGIFNHRNVVDQRLPGVQKTQQELMPVSGIIAPGRFAAGTAIGDRLPGAVVGFIARGPGFRTAAVGMRVG